MALSAPSSCARHTPSSSFPRLSRLLPSPRLITISALNPLSLPRLSLRRRRSPSASLAAAPATADEFGLGTPRKPLLEVKDLTAVAAETKQEILRGVNLTIYEGEVHAIMGKNGSGKSTFSKVLVGHPQYEVTGGTVIYKGEDLLEKEPEERSHAGIFMAFQSPVEIPGLKNNDFLLMAVNARRSRQGLKELEPLEFFSFIYPKLVALNMDPRFLDRNVNEGFSGGEKKRNEILQLAALEADLAVLDEIDSGLDVDALRDVARALNGLLTPKNSVLMITHQRMILDYIKPAYVHIMEDGRIVRTGDVSLAEQVVKEGYKDIVATR